MQHNKDSSDEDKKQESNNQAPNNEAKNQAEVALEKIASLTLTGKDRETQEIAQKLALCRNGEKVENVVTAAEKDASEANAHSAESQEASLVAQPTVQDPANSSATNN